MNKEKSLNLHTSKQTKVWGGSNPHTIFIVVEWGTTDLTLNPLKSRELFIAWRLEVPWTT